VGTEVEHGSAAYPEAARPECNGGHALVLKHRQ